MAFKRKKSIQVFVNDPESLFRDLRYRTVEGLLSHQADVLRNFTKEAVDKDNVAIELPTGSGKTLIGLLIAEFFRITKQERVLYLCPTSQLVTQVVEQASKKYGIRTIPFIGPKRDYLPESKTEYNKTRAIAVTNYSSLFNINPFFKDPNLIILDDAHSSENYIASNWSVEIPRIDLVYNQLVHVFMKNGMPLFSQYLVNTQDPSTLGLVDMVSGVIVRERKEEILSILDSNSENKEWWYAYSLLKSHLEACHIYVSYRNILIRPYIPPTMTHQPFANARQRILMSATLGNNGDLERITGLNNIHRIPIPVGWDRQGIGRRFFMFPGQALSDEDQGKLLFKLIKMANRTLILVPNDHLLGKMSEFVSSNLGFTIVSAKDLETSKAEFTTKDQAVAILANRYDGIDLSGEECRSSILFGLPKVINLQESFLMSRLACAFVLHDRIRTRIVQAVGRCTRSATDYASVCVVGSDFDEWFLKREKQTLFHPELQGELKFGSDQSERLSVDEFVDNFRIFLKQDHEWQEVEGEIITYRNDSIQKVPPNDSLMLDIASLEVRYQYSLWNENYDDCLRVAQEISDNLRGGNDLKGYRGFWNYKTAMAAWLAHKEYGNFNHAYVAKRFFNMASNCLQSLSWLRALSKSINIDDSSDVQPVDWNSIALDENIERIERFFEFKKFISPRNFEQAATEILNNITEDVPGKEFERAHEKLGAMLGFDSGNSSESGAPDPWWITHEFCFVSEDKNDSKPENPFPIKYTRQALTHEAWLREKRIICEYKKVLTIVISPASSIHENVKEIAGNLFFVSVDDFKAFALKAVNTLRDLRTRYVGPGEIDWRNSVRKALIENDLDPRSICSFFTNKKLSSLPTVSRAEQ